MALPILFVMWDNAITEGYGFSSDEDDYAHKFMPLMRKVVDKAIDSYMQDYGRDHPITIREITITCHGRTSAKVINEYN